MKPTTKISIAAIVFIIAIVAAYFFGSKEVIDTKPQPYKPTINVDSLEAENSRKDSTIYNLIQIATVSGEKADKAILESNVLRKSNTNLRNRLNDQLNNPNIPCEQRLFTSVLLNDSLEIECIKKDTAIFELDKEAQSYAEALYQVKEQRKTDSIILSGFKRHNKQLDSLYVLQQESFKKLRKQTKLVGWYWREMFKKVE